MSDVRPSLPVTRVVQVDIVMDGKGNSGVTTGSTFFAPPPPAPLTDPYFSSVVLLLHGEGANASTAFVDRSSYAHTCTAVGATQVSTAAAKFESSVYWSVPHRLGLAPGTGVKPVTLKVNSLPNCC